MPFQNWPRRVKNILFLTFNSSKKKQKKNSIKTGFQISHGCCQLAEHKGLCQHYNTN